MNSIKLIGCLILGSLLASCASVSNKSPTVPVSSTGPDYDVKERNEDPAPDWMLNFAKWRRDREAHGDFYYLGESGEVNDRIAGCDIAELNASKKIAQSIARLVTQKIGSDKQGRLLIDPTNSNDPGMERAFEERVASKAVASLSGTKEYDTYWENRDYSKINGNRRVFVCSVVVYLSSKDMKDSINRTGQKLSDTIQDEDAKAAVQKQLNDLDISMPDPKVGLKQETTNQKEARNQ